MSQIEIRCVDQTAMFTNLPEIFSGDVNIDTVKFTFDDSWNGYTTKTAVFYNNPKDVYPQILDVNDIAVIPSQVMTKQCKLSIGVFGTKANGDVKTSKILTYNVGKGAINSDLESTPATPDFWTQLLARQINYENNITQQQNTFKNELTQQQSNFENELTQQQSNFENNMESGFNTFKSTVTNEVDTLEGIVKGRNQALAYNSYSEMVTALNSMSKDELKRGQNLYIGTVGVPDLWVYGVETNKVTYSYVNDNTIVNTLDTDTTIQVGYYRLAQLETQKVDLTNIESDIDNLQTNVTELQTSDTDINALITALTNRVTELENASGGSEWALLNSVTNGNSVDISNIDFKELYITFTDNGMNTNTTFDYPIISMYINKFQLSTTSKYFACAGGKQSLLIGAYVYASLTQINFYEAYNANTTFTRCMNVYYR